MTRRCTTVARLFWQGHLTDLVAWGLGIVAVVLLLVDTFDGKASAHLGVWGIAVGLVVLGLWLAPARRQATRRNEAEAVREAEREVDQILERLVDRAERSVDELDRDRPDRSGGRSAR